jgi:sec-independent protein translocase protein TatA
MFRNFGTTEVILIAVVLIILFGGKRIPEFVRSLGQSVKEFRKAVKEEDKKDEEKEERKGKKTRPPSILTQVESGGFVYMSIKLGHLKLYGYIDHFHTQQRIDI